VRVKAFLILLGVAGALLALLLVGSLSRTTRPPAATVAIPTATTPATPLASVDPADWSRWRRSAGAICDDGKRRVQLQVNRIRLATERAQVLTATDRILRIQRRTSARLGRLERPVGLRRSIGQFLAVFRAQQSDDRRIAAQLGTRALPLAELEAALLRDRRRVARVTALAGELGVTACSRYADFDFYE
jgi:hypothetical protein